ncbi:MAG: SDR family oxidoreductase [bacterium]|nr:SDR family oxidoreductase [bacterium]
MDDTLITGGEGVLGSYCDFGVHVGRAGLDVTDAAAVFKKCGSMKPRVIVHAAALTNLVFCETHPDEAMRVNALGTENMARAAREAGAKLIYISTSDVFDGALGRPYTPEDKPNPVSVYGKSKYEGELAVMRELDDYVIMRVSWMFGGGAGEDNKFVGKLLALNDPAEFRAVTDKKGSPSWAKDVAVAIRTLIKQDARGLFHIGGGVATRYGMAEAIIAAKGWHTRLIAATPSDFPSAYPIGNDQSMPLSPYVRPWQDALCEYIETEWRK